MPTPEYFVVNDEKIQNSHGFRLLNSGGNFDRFRSNPVMLYAHDRKQVIGNWQDLKVEGTELRAKPNFDSEDPESSRIAGKVDRGFLKASSPGIYIEEAQYLSLPDGKLDLVVTRWELLEISVVGVPSNAGALAFFNKEGMLLTVEEAVKCVKTLAAESSPEHFNPKNMKIILSAAAATALGIAIEQDNAESISSAVVLLDSRVKNAEKALSDFKAERALGLIDSAIKEGRLEATRKDSFLTLATSDYNQASEIIAAMPAKQELGSKISTGNQIPGDRANWSFMDWSKKDPKGLEALSINDPVAFENLRNSYGK